jgi:hypothetical protein
MTKNNPTPQSFIRLELLCSLASQYGKSTKKEKMDLLNFLHRQFGISKNSLAKLLRKALTGPLQRKTYLRGRKPIYCDLCTLHLKKLWELMGRAGPEKMAAAMPFYLPFYAEENKLSAAILQKLENISARSIARLLEPHKKALTKASKCKTRSASAKFKYKIPVKNFGMKIKTPGFVEADTVAHCGHSLLGPHHWTLTVTDIASTWTEVQLMRDKTARQTKEAVSWIQERLPFFIKHFHSDCGTEFLNDEIMQHLQNPKRYIVQTRGRAYKKNDQAHVEQKNHSHVRELVGYYRYDTDEEFELINDIYQNEQRLLMNFFTPQKKLKEKHKVGSRYQRSYGSMKTPFQRVMESEHICQSTKERLQKTFEELNPIQLRRSLNAKLEKLMILKNRSVKKGDVA